MFKLIEQNKNSNRYAFSVGEADFELVVYKYVLGGKDFFLYKPNSNECLGRFAVNEKPTGINGFEFEESTVVLDELSVPFLHNRMRGYGTLLLNLFLAGYADKNIYLMDKPFGRHFEGFDFKKEMKRLESWYKKYGFVTFDENENRIMMRKLINTDGYGK